MFEMQLLVLHKLNLNNLWWSRVPTPELFFTGLPHLCILFTTINEIFIDEMKFKQNMYT